MERWLSVAALLFVLCQINERKSFQSHTREPKPGDYVENVNKGCMHYRSKGKVLNVGKLPNDMGKIVTYAVMNNTNNPNYKVGDTITKTMDQLTFL